MGISQGLLIPSLVKTGPVVSEEKIEMCVSKINSSINK
jgi:hypothetical protein